MLTIGYAKSGLKPISWTAARTPGDLKVGSYHLHSPPGRPAQRSEPNPPEPEPPRAGAEGPPSPEAPRSPARGAYLQSLEPSSRRWVLGGAKPPEEITLGPRTPNSGEPAGEIWYNPIPEEDPRPPAPEPLGSQLASSEPEGPIQGRHKVLYSHSHQQACTSLTPQTPGVPKPYYTQPPTDHKIQLQAQVLDSEVCSPYRCSAYQSPYQNLPYQVPRPCKAPLNEDEKVARTAPPPELKKYSLWPGTREARPSRLCHQPLPPGQQCGDAWAGISGWRD